MYAMEKKLTRISDLFDIQVARSTSFKTHEFGNTAFVSSGSENNGILGYVTPNSGDLVFDFEGICLSAFCQATVQSPPFIGRGNGGSGLIVLKPRKMMDRATLYFYASYINRYVRWRFSYGRMVTKERIGGLSIEIPANTTEKNHLMDFRPQTNRRPSIQKVLRWKEFSVGELFDLQSGDYHGLKSLKSGDTPLVSCGKKRNGVVRFVDVPPETIHKEKLTIAFNGQEPLTTHYHPYSFASKDDVAICLPRCPFQIATLLFVKYAIENERWRYSYGRKCFKEKLNNLMIKLPVNEDGQIDEESIEAIFQGTSYWPYFTSLLSKEIVLRKDIAKW
jgi:hypothetical protein